MKLSQYKEKKNHKKLAFVIVAIIFLIGGIIVDKTFANFKVQKSFKVMEGNFIYEGSGDVIFAFYNGDKTLTQMPKKGNKDNLMFAKGDCNNGATIEWNNEKWAPSVINLTQSKTKCDLYFSSVTNDYNALADLIDKKEGQLIYDGTDDNNLRFIGATPDNYVSFNNNEYIWRGHYSSSDDRYKEYNSYEECTSASSFNYNCEQAPAWRIIGVMNNIEDENGNMGSHLKLIRSTIGNYSWDSARIVNNKNGVNEWSDADIMWNLNVPYYYKAAMNTGCYEGYEYDKKCPKWENIGLSEEARGMISKIKWNTGTIPSSFDPSNNRLITPSYMYEMERSENTGKKCSSSSNACNDNVERTTSWTGYVGLMYPSDYGYATSGGGEEQRQTCLATWMNYWRYEPYKTNCANNNWFLDNYYIYGISTITPCPVSNDGTNIFVVGGYGRGGAVSDTSAAMQSNLMDVRPTLYLNSNVKIEPDSSSNYGSKENPYRLTM